MQFWLMDNESGEAVAIPVPTIVRVNVREFDEENEQGISTGKTVWVIRVDAVDDDYCCYSPELPTKDQALGALREIIESTLPLVDVNAIAGVWKR